MTDIYKAGKYYLSIGWSVLPIIPETKTPAIPWKKYQEERPNWDEVKEWLDRGWHLAVITGDISGVLVVDDDRVKHGLEEWGFTSPVTATTQSGGKHYYFVYNRELHSHSNADIRVDLKAWHSYCVLPPFNNRTWASVPSFENLGKMIPVSDDIIRLINSDCKTSTGQPQPIIMSDFIKIEEGGRTDALHKIACSIFAKYPREEGLQILLGINQTYSPPVTEEEFKYQTSRAYEFVMNKKVENEKEKIGFVKPKTLQDLIEIRKEERPLEASCPKTGLYKLDAMVKGFVPKHIYTMTGNTNVGKTSAACVFAVNVAKQGRKVLYLALEPDTGVIEYMASIVADKPFNELDPDTDYNFGELPIDVYTKKEVKTLPRLIELVSQSERYDLIIVDHIGYFVTSPANATQEQSNVMKILAELATSRLSSVLVIAHLRKPSHSYSKKQKIPTMDDISGSGAFKQDSTDVWILHKNLVEGDETGSMFSNDGLLIVAKTKNGTSGPIPITFGDKKAGIKESYVFRPLITPPTEAEMKKKKEQENKKLEEKALELFV